ncbi:hypothetical protein [Pantoea ananatis]|uniref:hypothetical protein n=1 Tax=Pantoea ananas TaxID=553 RepID=UPI000CF4E876|nr:hypothetical protein [Pantoea ananatis]PQK87841.1 hypothetical protein CG433_21990 [Pantoea ananatis]
MKLYHFTGVVMLHGILASEGINRGYFCLQDGKMLYGHSWYTSSPLPYGHGLADGTFNEKDKDFLKKTAGPYANGPVRGTHDKRLVRLTVDSAWLKQQETLYPFKKLLRKYEQPSVWGIFLGIKGWVDPDKLSDSEVKRWAKSPKLKHDTWYIHTETLPIERILSIEFMEKPDVYVPYDFELHGRSELEKSGIYSITSEQFKELNGVLKDGDFTGGEVFIICPKPDAEPAIVFRKRNSAHIFAIHDGRLMGSQGTRFSRDSLKTISDWVMKNSGQLMGLWNKSLENLLKYDS